MTRKGRVSDEQHDEDDCETHQMGPDVQGLVVKGADGLEAVRPTWYIQEDKGGQHNTIKMRIFDFQEKGITTSDSGHPVQMFRPQTSRTEILESPRR